MDGVRTRFPFRRSRRSRCGGSGGAAAPMRRAYQVMRARPICSGGASVASASSGQERVKHRSGHPTWWSRRPANAKLYRRRIREPRAPLGGHVGHDLGSGSGFLRGLLRDRRPRCVDWMLGGEGSLAGTGEPWATTRPAKLGRRLWVGRGGVADSVPARPSMLPSCLRAARAHAAHSGSICLLGQLRALRPAPCLALTVGRWWAPVPRPGHCLIRTRFDITVPWHDSSGARATSDGPARLFCGARGVRQGERSVVLL